MARASRPWFRSERQSWCVCLRGKLYNLGLHPDDFPAPRKQKGRWNVPQPILDRYQEVQSGKVTQTVRSGLLVAEVFEKYLDWCQKHRSPRSYEWYQNHIQSFLDSTSDARLTTDELKPYHVIEWVDAKPTWGDMHRRGAITAVQRAFTWAEKMGHIQKSPIRHIEKPAPKRREQVLTSIEFDALLIHVRDEAFRDVLVFCWETGCRVQEVRIIEAKHFKAERGRVELPPAQAKGKRRWRLIYLTEKAVTILTRLASANPEGPTFRNTKGNPWTAMQFNNRFCHLQPKVGVKYALTSFRHSYATRLLESGCDHLTVSALMGHASGSLMLSDVYSHIGAKTDYLRSELLKVSPARAGTTA